MGRGLKEDLYPSERLEIILDYETMRNNLIIDFCCCLTEAGYDIWILLQDDGKAGGGLGIGVMRRAEEGI